MLRHGIRPAPIGLKAHIDPAHHVSLRPAPVAEEGRGSGGVLVWGCGGLLLAIGGLVGFVLGHWLWH